MNKKKPGFRVSVVSLLKISVTEFAVFFPAPLPMNVALAMINDKAPARLLPENPTMSL